MNKKLIFILIITVFAFSFSAYQYVMEFQSELASAAYSAKPAAGHSWSEMECSEGFCVTADNKVGIGTSAPGSKLDVVGDINTSGNLSVGGSVSTSGAITATGDVCGAGTCLSQLNNLIGSQSYLVNDAHRERDCLSAGGEVVASDDASKRQCKFFGSSCPSGWTRYKNYGTYANPRPGLTRCSGGLIGHCGVWGDGSTNVGVLQGSTGCQQSYPNPCSLGANYYYFSSDPGCFDGEPYCLNTVEVGCY